MPREPSYLDGLEFGLNGEVRCATKDPRDAVVPQNCTQAQFEAAYRKAQAYGGDVVFHGYETPRWLDRPEAVSRPRS